MHMMPLAAPVRRTGTGTRASAAGASSSTTVVEARRPRQSPFSSGAGSARVMRFARHTGPIRCFGSTPRGSSPRLTIGTQRAELLPRFSVTVPLWTWVGRVFDTGD
jgi:hypothetical protein